jgi:hypothetical protein
MQETVLGLAVATAGPIWSLPVSSLVSVAGFWFLICATTKASPSFFYELHWSAWSLLSSSVGCRLSILLFPIL